MNQEVKRKCPECGSNDIEVLSSHKTFDETVHLFKYKNCELKFS